MILTPVERAEMYRAARAVLVRHYIDLGRVVLQISNRRILLRGSLVRLTSVETPLTEDLVSTIFNELSRIKNVMQVDGELDNWSQTGRSNNWIPVR